ncbi:MAG: transposase [Cyanobacteriota bacterium]|nr:transposase [Cyanobacteriota bacterium]
MPPGCAVLSDGRADFRSVTTTGCSHGAIVTDGMHPNNLPQFRWILTLLGKRKTNLSGKYHAFNHDKYADRYLGGYRFRFDRCFSMVAMTEYVENDACSCMAGIEPDLRITEAFRHPNNILARILAGSRKKV